MELSPAVDVSVAVNTALTTPDGFTRTSTAQPVMGSNTSYTSTFLISSFGRTDSGIYVCGATVDLASTNAYISGSSTAHHSFRVTTGEVFMAMLLLCFDDYHCFFIYSSGVYLALRGVHINNNSYINIRNIGQSFDNPIGAAKCITDNVHCCSSQNPRLGEWYQPNGALVQGAISTTAFYRTRGDNGEVFLNRPSEIESST